MDTGSNVAVTPESLQAEGWREVELGGFTGHCGPFWMRKPDSGRQVGLIVDKHHANNHIGTVHGGLVMTFADIALGCCVSDAVDHLPIVTVSLQTQFVSVARLGAFLTCDTEIVRKTRQLIFVRGLIRADGKTIASVEGMWKVLEPRTDDSAAEAAPR